MASSDYSKAAKLLPLMLEDEEEEEEVPQPALPLSGGYEGELDVSLDQFPRPQTRTTTQASDRLTHLHIKTQARLKHLRERKEQELREQCTFTPQLRSVSPPRSFKDFYTCQEAHEKSRKDRIAYAREEQANARIAQELSTLQSSPMSSGSRSILKDKHTLTLLQRLNVPKKPVPVPKPPVSPKAPKKQVQEIVERLNKAPSPLPEQPPAFPSFRSVLSSTSSSLITSALLRELSACWSSLHLNDPLNYRQFQYLLSEMGYTTGREQDLVYEGWKDLKGEERGGVSRDLIGRFLAGIEGETLSKASTEDTESSERGELPANLRAKYQILQGNRMLYRKKKEPSSPDCSFQPQLSPTSALLMEKLQGTTPKQQFQQQLSEKRTQLQARAAEETLQDMMKDCTFKPQIYKRRTKSAKRGGMEGNWVERLHQLGQGRKEEEKVDYEYERNKAELTFSPKINPAPKFSPRSPSPDVSKTINRLRSAYTESQRLRRLLERGVALNSPKHLPPASPPRSYLVPILRGRRQKDPSIDLMAVLGADVDQSSDKNEAQEQLFASRNSDSFLSP